MILTCPACSTKYVVKDGAIPTCGRQVRCASCKHSWHQDPEGAAAEMSQDYAAGVDAPLAEAPMESMPPVPQGEAEMPETGRSADDRGIAEATPDEPVGDSEPALPPERDQWVPTPGGDFKEIEEAPADDEFEPFYDYAPIEKPRPRLPLLLWLLLAVAVIAAAVWFLAPLELRQRLGIASTGETPLEVMVTNSDRQKLASGNELFAVSGRIINPTDRSQRVPPLRAELLDASKTRVVYSWTIEPPAATLAPRTSASFNSAEVDVPEGGSHLRVTLGGPPA